MAQDVTGRNEDRWIRYNLLYQQVLSGILKFSGNITSTYFSDGDPSIQKYLFI